MSDDGAGQIGLGIAGAVAGSFVGMPALGFALGSALGGVLFAEDTNVEGPRLQDLTVQDSSYGQPIALVSGRRLISGNVIWLEDNRLREVKHKEDLGGKGGLGPSQTRTTYTYHATFAVALCEGPIQGITRVWLGSKLVWNGGAGVSPASASADLAVVQGDPSAISAGLAGAEKSLRATVARRYGLASVALGSEAQTVHPRIEAQFGPDNTPAYRGLAYILFEDLELSDFGNAIPNVTVEVVDAAGEAYELRPLAQPTGLTFGDNQYSRADEGVIHYWAPNGGQSATERLYTYLGSPVDKSVSTYPMAGVNPSVNCPVRDHPVGMAGGTTTIDGVQAPVLSGLAGRLTGGSTGLRTPAGDPLPAATRPVGLAVYHARAIYLMQGLETQNLEGALYRYDTDEFGRLTNLANTAKLPTVAAAAFDGYTGFAHDIQIDALGVWMLSIETVGGEEIPHLYLLDPDDLTLIDAWDLPGVVDAATSGFIAAGDRLLMVGQSGPGWHLYRLDGSGGGTLLASGTTDGDGFAMLPIRADGMILGRQEWLSPRLGNPTSVLLSQLVERLAERAGVPAADIDAGDLTATVRGYALLRPGTLRSALEPLARAYQFDVVEQGYKLRFVPRGGAPAASLTQDDLAAHEPGQARPPELEIARELETALPRRVELEYFDADSDEIGYQYAGRITRDSEDQRRLRLPVVLTADEAAQVADRVLKQAWLARSTTRGPVLSMRWAALMPTDVVSVSAEAGEFTLRITRIDDGRPGLRRCEAVFEASAAYTSQASGAGGPASDQAVTVRGPSIGYLLDAPLLHDAADAPGFYVALAGALADWPGATLLRSLDTGQSYTAIESVTVASVLGRSTDALPAGPTHRIDEAGAVNVRLSGAAPPALDSTTDADLLRGANAALLGVNGRWELIQYRTATLEADGSHTLTGLLRGRRGTEPAVATHQADDRFVRLTDALGERLGGPRYIYVAASEIGAARDYKTVTLGSDPAPAAVQALALEGESLKPLAPYRLRGSRAGNDDLTITWQGRGRLGAGLRISVSGIDAYEVDVLDGTGAVLRTLTAPGGGSGSVVYTASDQVTDFGAAQASVDVTLYARHELVGRGYPASATV